MADSIKDCFFWLAENLGRVTVVFIVASVLWILFFAKLVKKIKLGVNQFIVRSLAAGGIPTGIIFVAAALWPEILSKATGMEAFIAVGGLVILFISFVTAFKDFPVSRQRKAANKP